MKIKAIVQILILVFATFSISLVAPPVVAQEKVCCERTNDGEYCMYTDRDNCNENYKVASASCEQTAYCKMGCCFDSDEGLCAKNTPRSLCEAYINNTWKDAPLCDITQCERGCCVLGTECNFVTQVRCKKETSSFPNVEMTFDSDIESESECIATCRGLETGACVQDDGTCVFTTREECGSEITTSVLTSANASLTGFHKDMLCSNDALGTDCARQQTTGCLPDKEEVYWFDSCGNPENIYSSDKEASYNNGFVLAKEASCTLSSAFDPNCGNCDYEFGTLCMSTDKIDITMTYGEYTCSDLSCPDTYESAGANAGTPKKNGESWCVYDGVVGYGRDLVGSRHYRHLCVAGEELVEPCEDFREEVCVQGILGGGPLPNTEAFAATGSYVEARCRKNRYEDCVDCNDIEECSYEECQGLSERWMKLCCAKVCCEKEDVRDCYWLGEDSGGYPEGRCVPQVPPGSEFWEYAASTSEISEEVDETPEASDDCSRADTECKVTWKQKGWSKIFNQDNYDCVENCHCTEEEWVIAGNNFCRSLGDCGAHFNFIGRATLDGYTNTASQEDDFFNGHKLVEGDLGNYEEYLTPTGKFKQPDLWDSFFEDETNWIPWVGILAMGAWGYFSEGKFGAGGATSGPTGIASWFKKNKGALGEEGHTAEQGKVLKKDVYTSIDELYEQAGIDPKEIEKKLKDKEISQYMTEESEMDREVAINALTQQKLEEELTSRLGEDYKSKVVYNADGTITVKEDIKVQSKSLLSGKNIRNAINIGLWIWAVYGLIDVFFTEYEQETYQSTCLTWQAPSGGNDCELCNDVMKPCTEYRCKSLGLSCEVLNEDDPGNMTCYNKAPNDATSPVITPWPDAIEAGFTYTETTAEGNKGYKINEEIPAFTPVSLGIQTNEPAQCKYSLEPSIDFDDMQPYFGNSLYKYEHEVYFSLPSSLSEEQVLELTNGGLFTLYIRCQDGSGNKNMRDYFIKFQTNPSPDLTPPVVELTSIENGAYLAFNTTKVDLDIYVNEPADCRWDLDDTDYEEMTGEFSCSTNPYTQYSFYSGLYECNTQLEDLPTDEDTITLYIRCQDQPREAEEDRNTNLDSYVLTFRTTESLDIVASSPSGVLYYPNPIMRVITSKGAQNGYATCAFSEATESFENMIEFYNTGNTSVHEQPFEKLYGDYEYNIICRDIAGNENFTVIAFTVAVDTLPPVITSAEEDEFADLLIITTDEPSTCEYSTFSFVYGEGTLMTGINSTIHEGSLEEEIYRYYLRCEDQYTNRMAATVYLQ